jgi:hypothetical protein
LGRDVAFRPDAGEFSFGRQCVGGQHSTFLAISIAIANNKSVIGKLAKDS